MEKLQIIQAKQLEGTMLDKALAYWRFKGHKIVFTNGCFDIIHRGHVEYLSKAASFGDILLIGLNSDKSVRSIKGPERPVQDEQSRSIILGSMFFVDAVILFDADTPYELIKKVQPDVLVKGADYKEEQIAGHDIVKASGGKVVTIDLVKGYSSTSIIEKMKK